MSELRRKMREVMEMKRVLNNRCFRCGSLEADICYLGKATVLACDSCQEL